METIQRTLEKMNTHKTALKELKDTLETELEKTEIYQIVLTQTLGGDYEISEKDAKKHALAVALKSLKN